MLPPVPVIEIGVPDVEAPNVFVSEIEVLVVTLGDSVTLTVATTPLATTLSFNPASRHVYDPALPEQKRDLPAAVAAGPATTLMDAMFEEEYVSVH